jgi:hypothetical protein
MFSTNGVDGKVCIEWGRQKQWMIDTIDSYDFLKSLMFDLLVSLDSDVYC